MLVLLLKQTLCKVKKINKSRALNLCKKPFESVKHLFFHLCILCNFPLCFCQGGTMLGPPDTVVDLGETEVSEEIFMDYLSSLGESTYRLRSLIPPFFSLLFSIE